MEKLLAIEGATPATLLAVGGALAVGAFVLTSRKPKLPSGVSEPHELSDSSWLLQDLPAYLHNEARIHDWMADNSASFHGELWVLRIPGQRNMVVIALPELAEAVLATHFDSFPRGEFQSAYLEPMFGNSLLNSDGKRWYHQRKAAAKFFSAKSLRQCMLTSVHKNVLQMYEVVDKSVAMQSSVDLEKLFHEFALQTFIEVGLGLYLRWIGHDEPNPLEEAIMSASAATLRRFRTPAFYWKILRALHAGSERELARSMGVLRTWIQSIISQSLQAAQKTKGTSEIRSVMELFLEQSHENVEGMGPDDLAEFVLTFVLAAYDTSSVSLTWFFLILAKYPRVEAKIRNEMAALLPSMGVQEDTYLTTDHAQKLVYLEATLKEVMRLYPAIPLMQRECVEDTVVCDRVLIRKGDLVGISPYGMARCTDVWGPDASEFKPERWIDETTGEILSVASSKFSTFSSGPRICIGMKLAMMELRVATANLLHRYRFELAAPNDASYVTMIGLVLKNPLIVKATPLSTSTA